MSTGKTVLLVAGVAAAAFVVAKLLAPKPTVVHTAGQSPTAANAFVALGGVISPLMSWLSSSSSSSSSTSPAAYQVQGNQLYAAGSNTPLDYGPY